MPSQPHLGRCSLDAPHLPSEVRQMRTLGPGRVSPTYRLLVYEMKEPLTASASETLTEGGMCRPSSWGVAGSISAGGGPLSPCFSGVTLSLHGKLAISSAHVPVDNTPAPWSPPPPPTHAPNKQQLVCKRFLISSWFARRRSEQGPCSGHSQGTGYLVQGTSPRGLRPHRAACCPLARLAEACCINY